MNKLVVVVVMVLCVAFIGTCMAGEGANPAPKQKEVMVDRNGDGKVDGVDIYNEDGDLIRRGYDTDGNKYVDRWEGYDENTGMPTVVQSDASFELR